MGIEQILSRRFSKIQVHLISLYIFPFSIFRLCGRELKNSVFTSTKNQMTIKFHSDSSYVDQGFTAEYEAFIPSNRRSDFYFV